MKIPETPPKQPAGFQFSDVLGDLLRKGKYDTVIEINENKYPYWNRWKYLAKEWQYDPAQLWAAAKILRGGKLLVLGSLPMFRLNAPATVQQLLHELDMNLGGTLQGESIIPTEEKERYLLSSLMEEAIASSQLEGAATTRKVAKEMLENNRKPRNHSEQMIANNFEAMKWIVANKAQPFTPDNIRQVHAMITRNTLSNREEEGTFRKDNEVNVVDVQTGNIVYHPPDYWQLDALIDQFCRFANDQDAQRFFIHPVSKGIIVHFLIGYLHPFADGNGRTARTLFYWYLLKKGYWLVEYMSISRVILNSKAQYARAYLHTEIDDNDLTYFVLYNLQCVQAALTDLKKYIQRKLLEKKNALALLRNTDFNDRQIVLLQEMIQDERIYFTVTQLEQWFATSNQTARNDLNQLVSAGLLEQRQAGKKMHYFPAKDFASRIKKGL